MLYFTLVLVVSTIISLGVLFSVEESTVIGACAVFFYVTAIGIVALTLWYYLITSLSYCLTILMSVYHSNE